MASEPNSRQTLAVLFGASSFRRAPKLAQGRAFYNSAQDFHEYLTQVLGLSRENVNWLFDDTRSPSDQLQDIRNFLENSSMRLKSEGTEPQDLVLYYVGHGLFWGPDHTYSFAIRATDEDSEGLTSIRASDLASIIKAHARFLRKFLILDCCFSAAAYKEFQSGPLVVSRVQLLDELPPRGTTLLCSASAQDPSLAPAGLSRTMFSNGLLKVLGQGHASLGPRLSLSEIGDLVKKQIREDHPQSGVRPEIHSPDQREGDIGYIPVFPNPAYRGVQWKAETKRTPKTAEDLEKADAKRKAQAAAAKAQPKADTERALVEAEAPRRNRLQHRANLPSDRDAAAKTETETARVEAEARDKAEAKRRNRKAAEKAQESAETERAQAEADIVPRREEVLTLGGHRAAVTSVAWSPDGERLATGSRDNTAKIWDAQSGTEFLTLRSHRAAVNSIAWSPDGKRLATGSTDNTAKIWDVQTGKNLLTLYLVDTNVFVRLLKVVTAGVVIWSVAWSPDGKRLATGGYGTKAKIWDATIGKEVLILDVFNPKVNDIAWGLDGKRVAIGTTAMSAHLCDAQTGTPLLTLSGHRAAINRVAWSPDGERLATGSNDNTAKIWDVQTRKALLTLRSHSAAVNSVAWSPDGKRLATGSTDNTAKISDVARGIRADRLPNVHAFR